MKNTSRPQGPASLLRGLGAATLSLLLVGMASGCATLAGSGGPRSGWDVANSEERVVQLEVRNQNFKDARVYALWDGERRRLGVVNGNSSQTFRIQWRAGATFRIGVDFVAGGSFVSGGLSTWPGDTFEFIIPPQA